MNLIETIAAIGITTNMAAMSWVMKTLYLMRQEISGTHARFDGHLAHLEVRVTRLERIFE